MKTISFNISDDAFELLKKISNSGFAEYREEALVRIQS